MKPILLLICFLILARQADAQMIRFTDKGNFWRTWYITPDIYPGKDRLTTMGGDTVIFGRHYQYLVNYYSFSIAGARTHVREDTVLGMVYYLSYDATDTTEHVLYNYNLAEGDTIAYDLPSSLRHCTDSVVNIDTVIINHIAHKSFDFVSKAGTSNRAYTVIEGVGCTNHPLFPITIPGCFEYEERLLCFGKKNICPAFKMKSSGCFMIGDYLYDNCGRAAIPEQPERQRLFVAPNPANTAITISTSLSSACNVRIFGTDGRCVSSQDILRPNQDVYINVAGLSNGLYAAVLCDDAGTITIEKFIVSH